MADALISTPSPATRRLFLASVSATVVAGAIAAVAQAFPQPAGKLATRALPLMPDPVFAAIDAREAARVEWMAAQDRVDELLFGDREMSRGPRVQIGVWTDLVRESPDYNQEKPYYLHSEDAIQRYTAGPSSKNRDRLLAEFRADAEHQKQLQQASGLTKAEEVCDAAFERLNEMEAVALRTVPTSLDGALALSEFAVMATHNGLCDDEVGAFEATMVAYFKKLTAAA